MLRGCTVSAPPHPSPEWSRSCARARRGRPQNSTVRLGRRATVAPPLRALSLPPALPPSRFVCRARPPPSLPPPLPPFCSSRGAGHSLGSLPSHSSSQFPSRQLLERRWRRGKHLRCHRASLAGAGVQLGCPLGVSLPRLGAPRAPTPARFSPKWAGRLAGSRRPCTAITG